MENKYHTLKWFISRIGKRIYRDEVTCSCDSCQRGNNEGILIADEQHAKALCMYQEISYYRDKK